MPTPEIVVPAVVIPESTEIVPITETKPELTGSAVAVLDKVEKEKKNPYNTTDGLPPRFVAGNLTPTNSK